jgi:hypothetical protein
MPLSPVLAAFSPDFIRHAHLAQRTRGYRPHRAYCPASHRPSCRGSGGGNPSRAGAPARGSLGKRKAHSPTLRDVARRRTRASSRNTTVLTSATDVGCPNSGTRLGLCAGMTVRYRQQSCVYCAGVVVSFPYSRISYSHEGTPHQFASKPRVRVCSSPGGWHCASLKSSAVLACSLFAIAIMFVVPVFGLEKSVAGEA